MCSIRSGPRIPTRIPLLLHHDMHRPVGQVVLGKATARGIEFTAELPTLRKRALCAIGWMRHGKALKRDYPRGQCGLPVYWKMG